MHALWARHGVPGRIQSDDGGPFVSPTGLGEVVRVCLYQGATPVFIPPREPWRNGTVEHFNDTFDKRFLRQERFTDLAHLAERAGAFERFHNAQHRSSATGGRAPEQTTTAPSRAPRNRSPRFRPAGQSVARSSSSASSALTTSSASSAARSRCPTAAPTSTSPPRWTSPCPRASTTCSSQATKASCSPEPACPPRTADPAPTALSPTHQGKRSAGGHPPR